MRNGILGVAVVLLTALPAAAQPSRLDSDNNLKNIGFAFHNYHAAYNRLPPVAIFSKDGKALLSWRVMLLPFLEQEPLYKAFKLDEPWDSEHNLKLLEKMPAIYGPAADKKEDIGKTYYRVFTGAGTVFEGTAGIKFSAITDGTTNTLLAFEAAQPVAWTRPEELTFKDKDELPKLFFQRKEGFVAVRCDGSVVHLRNDFDTEMMRWAILRADNMPVQWEKLER